MESIADPQFGWTLSQSGVFAWMTRKGISPKDVSAYEILYAAGGRPLIRLTMYFDEDVTPRGEQKHPTCMVQVVSKGNWHHPVWVCGPECPDEGDEVTCADI